MAAHTGDDKDRLKDNARKRRVDRFFHNPEGYTDSSASIQVKIRIKPALRAQIQEAAAEDGVSINQEIVYRLLRSFIEEAVLERFSENYHRLQRRVGEMEGEIAKLRADHGNLLTEEKEQDGQHPQADMA